MKKCPIFVYRAFFQKALCSKKNPFGAFFHRRWGIFSFRGVGNGNPDIWGGSYLVNVISKWQDVPVLLNCMVVVVGISCPVFFFLMQIMFFSTFCVILGSRTLFFFKKNNLPVLTCASYSS